MVLKIDMEKAFDRMSWKFIDDTLREVHIPEKMIESIMLIISTSQCRLLWNGEVTDIIKPSRGFRQGDPLSPLLFVLCMERLRHMIQAKVNEGSRKALKASRRGPKIS